MLKLGRNKILSIPGWFGENQTLLSLKKILIPNNLISEIQTSFFKNLKNLRVLDLSYNKLKFIDADISKLKNLKKLNLVGNLFQRLPNSLADLDLDKFELEWKFYENLESLEIEQSRNYKNNLINRTS